jgi:predicted DNA-binding ribbon-helix-helix protein
MCQIFINADPELYASRSRSIRLHGVATSLRLENLFWHVLEEIGERDGLSVPQLVGRLYDELSASGRLDEHANFTPSCGSPACVTCNSSSPAHSHRHRTDSQPRPGWVLAAERRPSA